MPVSEIRQNRPRTTKRSSKAANVSAVVRDVVAGLEQLAPMQPKTVVEAFRAALPQHKSAQVIHIVKLIVGLEAAKPRPAGGQAAKHATAADSLTTKAIAARSALLSSGQVLPSKDICAVLDFTRQALSSAVRDHRMFTVDVGKDRLYPAFYTDSSLDRQQLESVSRELGTLPGWSKWQFFTQPKASLGGDTPLKALKDGRFAEARRAAIGFADR